MPNNTNLEKINKIKEYAIYNDIVISSDDFQEDDFVKIIYTCISMPNNIITTAPINNTNDIFYWIDSSDRFAGGAFDGKVSIKPFNISDCIQWFVSAFVSGTGDLKEKMINLFANCLTSFIGKVTLLPNNESRCLYLRIVLLCENNPQNKIKVSDVYDFNKDIDGAFYCPFSDIFNCKKRNRESSLVCGIKNNYPFIETLNELKEIGVIELDNLNETINLV